MATNFDTERLFEVFPKIRHAPYELRENFFEHSATIKLDQSQTVWTEGDECTSLALILRGSVRVFKIGETGREITLYHINPGESCILTASCLMSEVNFPAFAKTETEVEAIVIPAFIFKHWIKSYPFWQEYVFNLLSRRLGAIISVVEEVAFRRVDSRIAAYLLSGNKAIIQKTHFEIATEVGTSREVVSRILKDFENRNIVSLSRGIVTIGNTRALLGVANET